MNYEALGKRIRQHRVLNQMTQEELAEKTGISSSFIGHIERGEKKASIETMVALCNALSVSPALLLQDSLTVEAMNSHVQYNNENRALVSDIMQVLREHSRNEYEF